MENSRRHLWNNPGKIIEGILGGIFEGISQGILDGNPGTFFKEISEAISKGV